MTTVRVVSRFYNARLYRAIHDTHQGPRQFADAAKVGYYLVLRLLNLAVSPYLADGFGGELRPSARKLCEYTGIGPDELWPPEIYVRSEGKAAMVCQELSVPMLPLHEARHLLAEDHSEDLMKKDRDEHVAGLLATLTAREAEVLRLLYGLGGDVPPEEENRQPSGGRARTLDEVGRVFGVTKERIRQIEAKALRKMRHPSRSRKLKVFLEGSNI